MRNERKQKANKDMERENENGKGSTSTKMSVHLSITRRFLTLTDELNGMFVETFLYTRLKFILLTRKCFATSEYQTIEKKTLG